MNEIDKNLPTPTNDQHKSGHWHRIVQLSKIHTLNRKHIITIAPYTLPFCKQLNKKIQSKTWIYVTERVQQ